MKLHGEYILGLDLGTNSVGWAMLGVESQKEEKLQPRGILSAGVHIFDAGTDGQSDDISAGRDGAKGKDRRDARSRRRQLERRARRKVKLLHVLQRYGLLPKGDVSNAKKRHEYFKDLDSALSIALSRRCPSPEGPHLSTTQFLPYRLRSLVVSDRLEPFEVGRALYHLGQRRGFLSNRKAGKKDDEEGVVKSAIKALRENLEDKTLGEYLAGLDPHETRIRGRYTSRHMYEQEFDLVWEKQAAHHQGIMSDEVKAEVHAAIFHQRPLRSQKHLIGWCELEPGKRRAARANPIAQRFRMLQQVNNLTVIEKTGEERELTEEERSVLVRTLERKGKQTFPKIRTLLGLPRTSKFNFERGNEKYLFGNQTMSKLADVFGKKWDGLSEADRDRVFQDVHSIEDEEALRRRGREHWGLDNDAAKDLAAIRLDQGYASHSVKAMRRLLPLMENGVRYATAKKRCYPVEAEGAALDLLPSVDSSLDGIRNPLVTRTLSEMRKVVNSIIREYGKPALIRVELARDLKKSRRDRQELTKRMGENQRKRAKAAEVLLKEYRIEAPSRGDIERFLLAEECEWVCPYTGVQFGWDDLFGPLPTIQVEHIIPYSRSLDNSYLNKTLCEVTTNNQIKNRKTPYEAFGHTAEWEIMLDRVRKFRGDHHLRRAKLQRFQCEDASEYLTGFTSRQLSDTRYASKEAREYLNLLYGDSYFQHVQVGAGQATALIRRALRMNSILGSGEKTRDDHRHHAVDAVAVALTSHGILKQLGDAARRAEDLGGRHLLADMEEPWPVFLDDVRAAVERITVSFRPNHKISGPLHKESHYGMRVDQDGKEVATLRKPLKNMTEGEIRGIVDNAIREAVLERLERTGKNPAQAFGDDADPLKVKGRVVRRARYHASANPTSVGRGERKRFVMGGSNHHLAIYETKDRKGRPKWVGEVVSRFEANRRAAKKMPVVQRDAPEKGAFVMSICPGDAIRLDKGDAGPVVYRVRSISKEKTGTIIIEYVHLNDAREKKAIKKNKAWFKSTVNKLREYVCGKVTIDHLGRVRRAND